MSDKVIFSQPFGSVLVDATVPCIITQWHAFANANDFIAMMEAATQYFASHSTSAQPWGWVGDVRQMGAIPAKAQAWLISEFNNRAVTAGLREMSIVVAETVFGQLSAQRYAQETANATETYELHTAFYNSLESAKAGAKRAAGTASK